MRTIVVTNEHGRTFVCRLVQPGELRPSRSPLGTRYEHGGGSPIVVIFDDRYAIHPSFPDLGQFVADYYLSTLSEVGGGLDMNMGGGDPEWSLTAENVQQILAAFAADQEGAP